MILSLINVYNLRGSLFEVNCGAKRLSYIRIDLDVLLQTAGPAFQ